MSGGERCTAERGMGPIRKVEDPAPCRAVLAGDESRREAAAAPEKSMSPRCLKYIRAIYRLGAWLATSRVRRERCRVIVASSGHSMCY